MKSSLVKRIGAATFAVFVMLLAPRISAEVEKQVAETVQLADRVVAGTPSLSSATLATSSGASDFESEWADGVKTGRFSFAVVLLVVFLGGVLTNLTPCVYPMIPITLRLLGRQGTKPLAGAAIYASGILVTYTALGVSAALSGSLFGSIMASKTFNLAFAALMALLALSMLGYGNFSALQTFGNRLGAGKSSPHNTFLMGVGAGLVASPCTGPILAALLAYTAGSQDLTRGTFLLFVYSLGFALPYVFLGGAAARVGQIKVSPNIQVATKALFASVMFALVFYYLKIPAYSVFVELRHAWFEIAATGIVVGGLLVGLSLSLPRLRASKVALTVPAVVLGVGLFGVFQSFTGSRIAAGSPEESRLLWHKNEDEAFREAKERSLPLLVDGWAEWCEACKKMDAHTFSDAAVADRLRRGWILLKLDLTESNEINEKLIEKYGFGSLPTLFLLPPDGDLTKKEKVAGFVPAATLTAHLKSFQERLGGKDQH